MDGQNEELVQTNPNIPEENQAQEHAPTLAETYASYAQGNQDMASIGLETEREEPEQPANDFQPEYGMGADGGGFTDSTSSFDPYAFRSEFGKYIDKVASQQAINELSQEVFNGGKPRYFDSEDLKFRTEDGEVFFRNPDNENKPFESRQAAEDYCQIMNRKMQNDLRANADQRRQQMRESVEPTLRMYDFVPTYISLDETTQEVLEEIIAPYEIRGKNGTPLGYNCDLNAALNQARAIVSRFAPAQQSAINQAVAQQVSNQQPSTPVSPALDMPTTSGIAEDVDNGPSKNLGEAMQKLAKQRWENKYGNQ